MSRVLICIPSSSPSILRTQSIEAHSHKHHRSGHGQPAERGHVVRPTHPAKQHQLTITQPSYPTPPDVYFRNVARAVEIRRFILRYLSLPRPSFMREYMLPDEADRKTGRSHPNKYLTHPYYIKPGFWNSWGLWAWFVWASGADVPGSKGDFYIPEGYAIEEVGPRNMKNKGAEEMKAWEEKLEVERPTGCPFAL